jgi:hypothetical protein
MVEIIDQGNRILGTLTETVRAYEQWLEIKAPTHHNGFRQRHKSDPEASRAEAAIFTLLRELNLSPFPAEDPSSGGADFLCTTNSGTPIVVEVSIVRAEAIAARSGLPAKIDLENAKTLSFSFATDALRRKATAKVSQLKGQSGSRVLAICMEHDYSDMLMGNVAAKWLMSGEPKISVPIGDENPETKQVTALRESVFFRFNEGGGVEACRQSISAILLVGVSEDSLRAIGLLHPDPAVPLDYTVFFPIPSLAVSNWPLHETNVIRTEWKVPPKDPDPKMFIYTPPYPTERELRGG